MSDLTTRSRAEAQRDIAIAALREIDAVGAKFQGILPDIYYLAGKALAQIAEIEASRPKNAP